jgi:6-phosphogluconolactonase
MSGEIDVFSWNTAKGTLTGVQRVHTVPHDFFGGNHSAEIEIHPSGRFLYESNRRTQGETVRGPDTIGVFYIDPADGTLSRVEEVPSGGIMPRGFALDPSGSYLLSANQLSNNVVVLRIDARTGRLSKTGKEITVETPVCIKFVPALP